VATKGEATAAAAGEGVFLLMPDTSSRHQDLPSTDETGWDLGRGAGYYLDATKEPWQQCAMESYILALVTEVGEALNINAWSITGHSMGGLGALHLGLRHDRFVSVSAFAPISHPSVCPWGIKAFTAYLGDDETAWAKYDPTKLVQAGCGAHIRGAILVDQGSADNFLSAGQLRPRDLVAAAADSSSSVTVEYRLQEGYDHSYYFIATFMRDHVRHHAGHLRAFVADAAAAKRPRAA